MTIFKPKPNPIVLLIASLFILFAGLVYPSFSTTATHAQVFNQVWQTVSKVFYDPNFNGVDWKSMQSKYSPRVLAAKSPEATAEIINQMLAELKTSHTYFYTPSNPAYYQILGIFQPRFPELRNQLKKYFPQDKIEYSHIGIFTKTINDNTFISGILDGSPAANAGLMVGDRIINLNGSPYHPIDSFKDRAGQPVKLLIQRNPSDKGQEISVTPKLFDGITMFVDAMQASVQIIEKAGKKIGYIHIWSYAGDKYQDLLESELLFGRLKDADALVLDLRDGWGGAPPNALYVFTARGPSVTNISRDGIRNTYQSQWNKPVVMLVNQGSRSAKEILAYSFKQYKIGTVVGAKTAGAVVAGRPFLMQDGSLLYVAVADVYVDGNQRLEGQGVTPDIVVPFPLEYAGGKDPQKQRAIEVAVETIK